MPAESVRLDLREDAIQEVVCLARAADRLQPILEAIGQTGPSVGTAALAKHIAGEVSIPAPELRPIFMALLNVYHTQTRLKLSAEDVVEAIASNLRRVAKTQDAQEQVKAWETARNKIVEAVKKLHPDHPLEAAFKAFRVATARQYELVGMRIYTDARPVFNAAGDAIVQTVISHVLSLDYHDGDSHRVIQFSLDAADVTELRELCERADRKAGVIKRDLKQSPWPSTIFREAIDPGTSST